MSRMRKHVVFVIDASRSMDKRDVFDKDEERVRRVDAVLDCIFDFIEDQRYHECSTPDDRYSVISFNDVPKVQLRGKSMWGRDLHQLRRDLEAKIVPRLGTSYGAGLSGAFDVARGGINDAGEQCVLIFLSDGRPVDMNVNAKREQFPSELVRDMRETFRRRMTFHGVGVGPEDFTLLEKLCSEASGEFHAATLMSMQTYGRGGRGRTFTRAPAIAGRAETLSDAFSNISSTVSSMCTLANSRLRRGLTLEDVEEAEWNNTNETQYYCDKLTVEGSSLIVHQRDLVVRLRHHPFAEGGMRHCFRMWDMGALGKSRELVDLVAKRSKFVMHVEDELKTLKYDLRCHKLAKEQASVFNRRIRGFAQGSKANGPFYKALKRRPSGLQVAECDVYKLEDSTETSGFRYLLVEPFLDGKYIKYNGNNGYIGSQKGLDDCQRCWGQVAQAFSHYTYHNSDGEFLICDMQGVDHQITDPAVHSKKKTCGAGDRGTAGMMDFIKSHKCNSICRHLGLPEPSAAAAAAQERKEHVALYAFSSFVAPPVKTAYERKAPAAVYSIRPLPVYEEEEEEEDDEDNYVYAF